MVKTTLIEYGTSVLAGVYDDEEIVPALGDGTAIPGDWVSIHSDRKVKGADLGREADRMVVDFNFSYNPSCAYNSRWHCPLPPPENQLSVPILAGELRYP